MEILVVELLVAEFNLRHDVSSELVFEYRDNFMCSADTLRITGGGRGAHQQEPARCGGRRIRAVITSAGIDAVSSQETGQRIRVACGERVVSGEKYLLSTVDIGTCCPDVNLFGRGAFPIIICSVASRASRNVLAGVGRRAIPRNHPSVVVFTRVLGKQRHLLREGEVCVKTIIVGNVLQDPVKVVRTGRGCRTRKEIQSRRAVGVASLIVIVLSRSTERGKAEPVGNVVFDQCVTAVSYSVGLVESPMAALVAGEGYATAIARDWRTCCWITGLIILVCIRVANRMSIGSPKQKVFPMCYVDCSQKRMLHGMFHVTM